MVWRHALLPAVPDAIELSQVAIDGLQAVVGFAGDLLGRLALGEALPADEALVGEAGTDVMEGGPSRDEGLGLALVIGQQSGDGRVVDG